jgi:hypothetical protein
MDMPQSASDVGSSESSDTERFFEASPGDDTAGQSNTADVIYEVDWTCGNMTGMYKSEVNPYEDSELHKPPKERPPCVFSIVLVVRGVSPNHNHPLYLKAPPLYRGIGRSNQIHYDDGLSMPNNHLSQPETQEKRPEADFQAISVDTKGIRIYSSFLIQAIRSIVKYYPSQNLKSAVIYVESPFKMLLHHLHDLRKLRDTYAADSEEDTLEDDTVHGLTLLLEFLKPYYTKSIQAEELRYQKGLATSDTLWFLYRPGCNVYGQVKGIWRAFVVYSAGGASKGSSRGVGVSAWYIVWKGDRFCRRRRHFFIEAFEGERKIASLPLIPTQYFEGASQTSTLLEKRGQRYCRIMQNIPRHMKYNGEACIKKGLERVSHISNLKSTLC